MRRIVFVKHIICRFDDLKVKGKPAHFDSLLHLPNRDNVPIQELTATYNGEKASLAVRSFAPNDARLTVENGRIPYHVFSARTPAETSVLPAYLALKTSNPLSEAQFLTAIVPAKDKSAAQAVINQMTEIVGDNLKGIRVERGNETDLVIFRGAETQTIRQGEWSADAETLTITQSANNLKIFAIPECPLIAKRKSSVVFKRISDERGRLILMPTKLKSLATRKRRRELLCLSAKPLSVFA